MESVRVPYGRICYLNSTCGFHNLAATLNSEYMIVDVKNGNIIDGT